MTLAKAIEILAIHNDHDPDYTDKDRRDARHLGIEALKCFLWLRKVGSQIGDSKLPGEDPL